MIVPSSRLLFWTGCAVVPCVLAAATVPAAAGPAALAVAAIAAAALLDLARGRGRLAPLRVTAPAVARLARDRDGAIALRIAGATRPFAALRVGLVTPPEAGARQEDVLTALPAGGTDYLVPWPCRPVRRGRYTAALCGLECASPWGFWQVRRRLPVACEIRVYPDLRAERRRVAALFLRRGGLGVHRWRQVGKGREFEKLREYIPGDSYEDIHWKATARRRHPIVKVFQLERTQEVYVVLDSSRLSARPSPRGPGEPGRPEAPESPATVLDRFISAGLMLALAAEGQGDRFGLLEFNRKVGTFLRAGRGKGHFEACRHALYTLVPERVPPDYAELFAFVRTRLRKRALLVVLTSLDDSVQAENLLRAVELVRRQHLVTVHMLRPPGARPLFSDGRVAGLPDLYRQLEGHETWRRLEETGQALRRRGVHFEPMDHERLSAGLISQYMQIKGKQLI